MTKPQGKFQFYFHNFLKQFTDIKDRNNYKDKSKAFAHWFLVNFYGISENDVGENIVDDFNDNGVDAIYIQNQTITLFQFKFPDKVDNIGKAINETTVLKMINGYKKLTSKRKPTVANPIFLDFWDRVRNENIFRYELKFVSYTEGFSQNAIDALNTEIQSINESTGNNITYDCIDKKQICDKFDKLQKMNSIDIELSYKLLYPSYNLGESVKSWLGFTNAEDILESCKDNMDVIFDENIRNYEGENDVNKGIIATSSNEDSKNFYFFHNGIVFITDKCNISMGTQVASLKGAAIINGCQSVVALSKAFEQKILKDDVFLPIRIIETSDIDLRAKITEYLNSQSKIKDSYFLSNNSMIRLLQEELLKKGYFLERLANEYSYKKSLNKIEDYSSEKILSLEKTIQVYAGYYKNDYAAVAKRGKSELFNKEIIDNVIDGISADNVLSALDVYSKVCAVITNYRKCKRAEKKEDFLEYMGHTIESADQYDELMKQYLFMNTADILLLNAVANINTQEDFDAKVKKAIITVRDIMKEDKKAIPSGVTKNAGIFAQVRAKLTPQVAN